MRGYRRDDYLFSDGDLSDILRSMQDGARQMVDAIPKDQFLSNSIDDLVTHISAKLKPSPLKLYEDSRTMQHTEVNIDVSGYPNRNVFREHGPIYVPGVRVTVSIPYSGTYDLWKLKPNRWQSIFPHGQVTQPNNEGIGSLDIIIEQPNDEDPAKIKEAIERELQSIRVYLGSQKQQIEQHNSSIESIVRQHVEARRERLTRHDKLSDLLEIPLKQDDRVPSVKPIDMPKIVQPLAPAPKSGYKPEPGIVQKGYEHILSIIKHVGRTFETTPKTYYIHDEEELRDILLANLNSHFKGGATGETFRKSGKTDIKIESENRSAFVAECKVWKGQKEILEAIDQLLGYLTWRDCKAAIVIFNKHNSKFTEILDKIPTILQEHPKMKKFLGQKDDGEWDFIFMSEEDEGRLIYVRVFIFNVYYKP